MHACIYILLIMTLYLYINWKLDENILPREIQKIVGNEYFLQLHLDEYNLKCGRENYIVSKILEADISHKHYDLHKVEVHKVIIS